MALVVHRHLLHPFVYYTLLQNHLHKTLGYICSYLHNLHFCHCSSRVCILFQVVLPYPLVQCLQAPVIQYFLARNRVRFRYIHRCQRILLLAIFLSGQQRGILLSAP